MTKIITLGFISPNFCFEKLESPSFDDLLDVFEDRMRNWYLLPALKLLGIQHCQIAAVSLLISYFEGIEIYLVGEDSEGKSAKFFANGFLKVFKVSGVGDELMKKVANAMHKHARCGVAHDSMFRNRVFFSETYHKPILVTCPKKNGVFDTGGDIESIVINPTYFYKSIQAHFDLYIQKLREGTDLVLKQNFEAIVDLKWALNEPDRVIGMTESEFYSTLLKEGLGT
jgi:hypothetical protein